MLTIEIKSPAVTATPFKVKLPLVGSVSIRTPAKVWPASASAKPKSAGAKVSVASSLMVLVMSAPVGGVLVPTFTVNVLLLVAPWLSTML